MTSGTADWDLVDEASFESFPASDPPGWGSFHAAASADTVTTSTEPGDGPAGAMAAAVRESSARLASIVAAAALGAWLGWVVGSRRRPRSGRSSLRGQS